MARVQLISVTPSAESNILFCARVSSDQTNDSTGLLKYLIKNKHWSPFEMAHMVLEVRTSRAIAQQILRHRSFSFQEFSQRYATAPGPLLYQGRRKGSSNRQSSIDDLPDEVQQEWITIQRVLYAHTSRAYKRALDLGIATECARFVLPQATETKLYMAGSVRSWIHYLEQRTDEHTQWEHRELALEAREIFIEHFPIISEALDWLSQEKVFVYSLGNVNASVCAPADMSVDEVTAEVNRQHPTGLSYGWKISEETRFRSGEIHPCPCEENPNRIHRLFHC